MSFNDYQWHDDYERESVMRAMCNMCNTKKGECNECNECLDHWLKAGRDERRSETENQK